MARRDRNSTPCANCGAPMGAGDAFCGACGTPRDPRAGKGGGAAAPPGTQGPYGPRGVTPQTSAPVVTKTGIGTLLLSFLTLVAVAGALVGATFVVNDEVSEAAENQVTAGKVSVIGAAKFRRWTGSNFELQLPATWAVNPQTSGRIGPGKPRANPTDGIRSGQEHEWLAGNTGARLSIAIQTTPDKGKKGLPATRDLARNAAEAIQANLGYGYVELGPVTAKGGRWVWRWIYARQPKVLRKAARGQKPTIDSAPCEELSSTCRAVNSGPQLEYRLYFLSTCRDGRRAENWAITTVAPVGKYPEAEFASALGSLKSDLAAEKRDGTC